MRYLFYLAHPAHFHLFRPTIEALKDKGHEVLVTSKAKDVLQDLLASSGFNYLNISAKERKATRTGMLQALMKRTFRHLKICLRYRPHIFVSTSAEFAPFCRLLGIKAISIFEDDLTLFPKYSRLLVPFLHHQLCPESCFAGRWDKHPKTVKYRGNQELAYLRPDRFIPDEKTAMAVLDAHRPNFLIRFSGLTAWHDENARGISDSLAGQIIALLEPRGRILITSERPLPGALETYRVRIRPEDLLHVLYYADLYIGDSQTMTAEAAVLGTPAVRFNDFVGKIGYLEELEKKFGLAHGIPADRPDMLLKTLGELLERKDLKTEAAEKRKKLLENTIDPTLLFVWFLENYPDSARELSLKPDLQLQFKSKWPVISR